MNSLPHLVAPGRCIYCDGGGELTREHVIPAGIKGDIVLPGASCLVCKDITGNAEQHSLRVIYGLLRSTTGIHSARRKKTRPSSLRVVVTENGVSSESEIPWPEVPAFLHQLILPPPGLVTDAPETHMWPEMQIATTTIQKDFHERGKALNANLTFKHNIIPVKFTSMLAKIALGYAVCCLGVDGFVPLVRDLCKLKEAKPWNYVGSDWEPAPGEDRQVLHELRVRDGLHELQLRLGPSGYLVVGVRLFAVYNLHPYAVVVGVPK